MGIVYEWCFMAYFLKVAKQQNNTYLSVYVYFQCNFHNHLFSVKNLYYTTSVFVGCI